MNEDLAGRLHNWKFKSALKYLPGESYSVRRIIQELAESYGDIGWIPGDTKIKTEIEDKLSPIDYEPPSMLGLRI